MTQRLVLIVLALVITPLQAGHNFVNTQSGQEISDAQKTEFIELLKTLPTKGEFYTEEASRRAGPYLPVIFSLTEKDIEKLDLYAFVAISVGISADKARRDYAVAHFTEIRHPQLKLFWAALLFDRKEVSPEIVRYLRDALDSDAQANELKSMAGPNFKFFKRAVRQHPFAQDGRQNSYQEDEGHVEWVSTVAFSPDNKTLVSGSHDGTMIVWDVDTGRQLRSIEGYRQDNTHAQVTSVAFSPDGKTLLSAASDKSIRFWDASSGAELRAYRGDDYATVAIFSPDGKTVAAVNCHSIILLEASTAKLIRSFRSTTNCPDHIAFSPDGRTLLNDGGIIQVRDLALGRAVKSFGANARGIALAPDGKSILLGGEQLELWSVTSGRLLHRLPQQPSLVEAMAFSPDGKTVAFESQDGTKGFPSNPFAPGIIKLWDVTTATELYQLTGHTSRISALVFSSDGKWLASGSWDYTVKLWDVSSGKLIRSFPAEKKEQKND